jgi:hypothetical protein
MSTPITPKEAESMADGLAEHLKLMNDILKDYSTIVKALLVVDSETKEKIGFTRNREMNAVALLSKSVLSQMSMNNNIEQFKKRKNEF